MPYPELLYIIDPKPSKLHFSSGNSKTGAIPAFNTLPGTGYPALKDGTIICDVPGTCQGCDADCIEECYAMRALKRNRTTTARPWAENTRQVLHDPRGTARRIVAHLIRYNIPFLRLHVSGEFPNYQFFEAMADELQKARASSTGWAPVVYCYTKRAEFLQRWADERGPLPSNFRVTLSQWGEPMPNPLNVPEFWYDDGTDPEISKLPHCPAVSAPKHPGGKGHATGTTCQECRHCIDAKPGERWAVYAH